LILGKEISSYLNTRLYSPLKWVQDKTSPDKTSADITSLDKTSPDITSLPYLKTGENFTGLKCNLKMKMIM
jgi:hypothetical protein